MYKFLLLEDFPSGPVAKTPHFQCRRQRFDPWAGDQIPHGAARAQMLQGRPGAARRGTRSHMVQLEPTGCREEMVQPNK